MFTSEKKNVLKCIYFTVFIKKLLTSTYPFFNVDCNFCHFQNNLIRGLLKNATYQWVFFFYYVIVEPAVRSHIRNILNFSFYLAFQTFAHFIRWIIVCFVFFCSILILITHLLGVCDIITPAHCLLFSLRLY